MKFLGLLLLALCLLMGIFAEEIEKTEKQPICPCSRNLDPVCGSNFQSYNNRCLFECARRSFERQGRSLQLLRSGNC
ncbi:sperm-associated acrosin inhibitor-like [Drosophila sulfurigaster albostrigata]|uniref:sperm-associated acrosin inhibitor n=1 Tax=Drosophila nasuta TaxID=42062 RepID=UPI00295ED6D1|nr:sperm-associated acrosin inhibitor [Drosophila nasuta]XP_062133589.1 sperm-associated acrosin inhibitor-like [Drosophila sulfurigaster albostrigata]